MTKRDFEAIAAIFKKTEWNYESFTLARAIADYCEKINPRFDRTVFLYACFGEEIK